MVIAIGGFKGWPFYFIHFLVQKSRISPFAFHGFHPLNRAAFKAFGVLNKFGDSSRAGEIIQKMGLPQDAIDAARVAWKAGQS